MLGNGLSYPLGSAGRAASAFLPSTRPHLQFLSQPCLRLVLVELRQLCISLPEGPGASGNAFSFPALTPCLPSLPPAASSQPQEARGQEAVACWPAERAVLSGCFNWGPSCSFLLQRRGRGGEAQDWEVQLWLVWSGPQIRGPGPVTQWALGRACSYGLLQTANHRQKSLPGARTVFTDILPQTHLQLWGRAPRCRVSLLTAAPSSLQEPAWPTTKLPPNCPPAPSWSSLPTMSLFYLSALSPLLQEAFLECLWCCMAMACPSRSPQSSEPSRRVPRAMQGSTEGGWGHQAWWDLTSSKQLGSLGVGMPCALFVCLVVWFFFFFFHLKDFNNFMELYCIDQNACPEFSIICFGKIL